MKNSRRVAVVAWPVVMTALLLSACGSDDTASPSLDVIDLAEGSTAFVTRPPVTTAAPTEPSGTTADDTAETGEQTYTVKAGDVPFQVAANFDITFEELQAANPSIDFTTSFPVGQQIVIPAGAKNLDAPEADTGGDGVEVVTGGEDSGDSSADEDNAGEDDAGEAIPDPGSNCDEGSYTIEAGDIPFAVAEQFDVTFDALQAANPSIDFTTSFPVGQEIVIPAKSDC